MYLANDDAGRERPGVAWAVLRGSARAAMGLLWLLVLAVLASEVRVAGGAETFRNSTEGKVGHLTSASQSWFCMSCKVKTHPGVCPPNMGGSKFRIGRKGSGSVPAERNSHC